MYRILNVYSLRRILKEAKKLQEDEGDEGVVRKNSSVDETQNCSYNPFHFVVYQVNSMPC